jgi:hypothetical protein
MAGRKKEIMRKEKSNTRKQSMEETCYGLIKE